MDAALDNALRLLMLGFPAALGAIAGAAGLFDDPHKAIDVLNRYALTFGFPALVLRGLLGMDELPAQPVFWAVWPVSLGLLCLGIRALAPKGAAGTLALVAAFGNVAYLGLPYVEALYGAQMAGPAALAVSIHSTFAVSLGPLLLERWGSDRGASWGAALKRVARMPLFWAPFVGLLALRLPLEARQVALPWIAPVASSAAPVALFLIGLHVFVERRRLAAIDAQLFAHVGIRQLMAPAVVGVLSYAAVRAGMLTAQFAQVHVLLASMPAAIGTFSMAHHVGAGQEQAAAAVVWSSALALVVLPVWAWVVVAIF
ncbi:MAG: AEC family transporter [Myxococcota bacterium]